MHLKRLKLHGFKSFAQKIEFVFDVPIIAIVGPNGSGKSNIVEAIRFVLGEQSVKSMRGKTGSDLIFKGSREISKMSRASVVITFDNSDRVFHFHQDNNQQIDINFDDVIISREVYSDGSNRYMINGSEVRMKDIHELIASVNIGSSGHHIISQGESDRYLNANIGDRRELIEEALGLRIYQYRIKESQRKLKRAHENIRESEILRRELAPHLKFLKRQVDKAEKAKHLKEDLHAWYQIYFAQEKYLIKTLTRDIDTEREIIQKEYNEIRVYLNEHANPAESRGYKEEAQIENYNCVLKEIIKEKIELRQSLGRIEGTITILEKRQTPEKLEKNNFSYEYIRDFLMTITSDIESIDIKKITSVQSLFNSIRDRITKFLKKTQEHNISKEYNNDVTDEHKQEQKSIVVAIANIEVKEKETQSQILILQKDLEERRIKERETERLYYDHNAKKKELDVKRTFIQSRDESLGIRMQSLHEEHEEAKILLGLREIHYQEIVIEHEGDINIQSQEQLRRDMERIKIRLEDLGGGSDVELFKEYTETLERDQFLEKEINDIYASIDALNTIINELKDTLDEQFEKGVQKINDEFNHFFKLMFGGGKARLIPEVIKKRKKRNDNIQLELLEDVIDEEKKVIYGIDIKVQLPRKKVSDLDMLSGGERSLTSIALLFALSQVNPPPFLMLDETDAALDEANSQKYGNMIESLSKHSQLILVTHNRETMSRAQTLFGVTLGRGDASRLLSLRLEDATQYAK